MPLFSMEKLLSNASTRRAGFEKRIQNISYRDKGVLFSEMLFLVAAVGSLGPRRIFESGRAKGVSTRILSSCFPNAKIISIDIEDCPMDTEHADSIVSSLANVTFVRGDARTVLPEIVQAGDVVLIDGPKSFRAIVMGLELLSARQPAMVFIHDLFQGQVERDLLQNYVPETIFSDDEDFVDLYRDLDKPCWEAIRRENLGRWQPYEYAGMPRASYGPTLACLPLLERRDYRGLIKTFLRKGFLERARYVRHTRMSDED